ncbi:hypothetical protein GE21DRAFT_1307522 [Neurospora crassa]|nr:hypothetical protein GE21DRAFT_1307522 [Neurospora crassa]
MKPGEEQVWPLDCFIGRSSPRSGPGVSTTPARNAYNLHLQHDDSLSQPDPNADGKFVAYVHPPIQGPDENTVL